METSQITIIIGFIILTIIVSIGMTMLAFGYSVRNNQQKPNKTVSTHITVGWILLIGGLILEAIFISFFLKSQVTTVSVAGIDTQTM